MLADTPPATPIERAPYRLRRLEGAGHQGADHRPLETGAQVGNLDVGQPLQAEGRLAGAHVTEHRRLHAAEAEVEPAVPLRRVAVAVREACRRQVDRRVVAGGGQPVDHRAAGITQPDQLGDLVVGLAGGVVAGAAEQPVLARLGHQVETGVPARHHQDHGRQRQRAVGQPQRLDVSGEVVHRHQRQAVGPGGRLGEGQADQERPDQPRSLRDGDGIEPVPGRPRGVERLLHHPADVAHVLPRGQFRHDPAPFAVDRHLRGDDVRADRPGAGRIARVADDGGRRLVARRLDAEQRHASLARPSAKGGWTTPRSVTIAVT